MNIQELKQKSSEKLIAEAEKLGIENESTLVNSIEVNSIILEDQKIIIRSTEDLEQVLKQVLKSNQKTILLVIYNSQNQRRYIGIKLD